MNADGSRQTNASDHPANEWGPAWSSDGARIAFSSTRDDHHQLGGDGPLFDIYVTDPNGSDQVRVTEQFGQFATWSPDGRFILVSPGGYVVGPDGSGMATLPASGPGEGLAFADWIP